MKKLPIFYNALMLTGVNLLLRLVSTSFQVFISGRIGPSGVGLLQLVLSVGAMAMTAGIAGIRTATMYLTAEELGRKRPRNVTWILSGCVLYSLIFSLAVGLVLYSFAPWIAAQWIGDMQALLALRLLAVFLPVSVLSGVMIGYFTAANRIATLAAVEVAEQLCSMAVTTMALVFWAGSDRGRACQAVVLGSCLGSCLTLVSLVLLRLRERPKTGPRIPVGRRLSAIALPLALADDLKVGITTTENLMVPKRLALYSGGEAALAQFGTVCGMVFPVLMFPAAILYGLADLLIPELARCSAADSRVRIRYLARRSLRLALFYGIACGLVLFFLAEPLSLALYNSREAGEHLRRFALLAPMLYCDAIIDAMNKGLGKQQICVRFNILTSVMDVVGLYVLLPTMGMKGYFISFLASHVVNFVLSLGLLLKTTGLRLRLHIPVLTAGAVLAALLWGNFLPGLPTKATFSLLICFCTLRFCGVLSAEDITWLFGLAGFGKKRKKPDFLKNNI
jgi:stage V sporulation protein B